MAGRHALDEGDFDCCVQLSGTMLDPEDFDGVLVIFKPTELHAGYVVAKAALDQDPKPGKTLITRLVMNDDIARRLEKLVIEYRIQKGKTHA